MRRADRLFQIIQVLRRTRKPMTADAIAAELETSKRTIYRDIATLIGQRVRSAAKRAWAISSKVRPAATDADARRDRGGRVGAQWVAGNADPAGARGRRSEGEDRRYGTNGCGPSCWSRQRRAPQLARA